jgi:putative ABC transport system permease protein
MPLFTDLRQGFRSHARTPGFLALAAGTLALGIGSAAVMFSVAESVLWRPLPFPDSERLVLLPERSRTAPADASASLPNFLDWRARARSFEGLGALSYSSSSHVLTGAGERIHSTEISAGLLETLGVHAALGRTFDAADEKAGARLALLSDEFWRSRFAASSDAPGRTFTADRESYTVVGVLPATFHLDAITGGDDPQFFVPIDAAAPGRRDDRRFAVIGRLGSGRSEDAAGAEMRAIAGRLAAEFPQEDGGWDVRVQNLREYLTSFHRTSIFLFLGFAALVLLIACANVAGLQLIRSTGRRREYAMRLALGAGRPALLRQAMAEAAWIAIPGAIAGALLGAWGVAAIRAVIPPGSIVRAAQISMDVAALAFILGAAVAVTFLMALVPVLLVRGIALDSALRAGAKSVSAGPRARRAVNGLVAVEMTLSFLLLFGSGLFLSTHARLKQVDLGFDPRGIAMVRAASGGAALRTSIPDAVWASAPPLAGGEWIRYGSEAEPAQSLVRVVSPGFFEMLHIPLVAGRTFTPQDATSAPRVAIVNRNFARAAFGGENPVGRTVNIVPGGDRSVPAGPVRIVGLAANTRELGRDEVPFQDIYLPFAQNPRRSMTLLVRTSGPPSAAFAALREDLQKIGPDVAIFGEQTFDGLMDSQFRGVRFRLALVSIFAALAAVLAAVGIYGAIAFSVAQRRREFGLRLALGAAPAAIRRATVAQSARLAGVAVTAGVGIALAAGRMLGSALYLVPRRHSGVLYGIGMSDPATLAAAAAIVLLLASAASLEPAGRAAGVDPSAALREE